MRSAAPVLRASICPCLGPVHPNEAFPVPPWPTVLARFQLLATSTFGHAPGALSCRGIHYSSFSGKGVEPSQGDGEATLYTADQVKASRAEGRKLTGALAAGQRPPTIPVPFRLRQGEQCYTQGPAQLWQFLEGDGTYVHKSRGGFGLVGLALVTGTAAGNKARKSRAAQEAAPKFRPIDEGTVYLTDQRFVLQGRSQWSDFWHEDVRVATCDGSSMTLEVSGAPPVRLYVWPVDYYFALFHYLANNDIIRIPSDEN